MEWSLLQSLFYGFVSGLTAFLPVSSDVHGNLLAQLYGAGAETALFRLLCRAASLVAVLIACRSSLARLRRERKLAAQAARRRQRQPDRRSLLDSRVLRTALPLLLLAGIACCLVPRDRLWLTVVLLLVNGIVLLICSFRPIGNKNSQAMSALDAALMGFCGGLGVLPGLSGIGLTVSACRILGGDRSYALEMGLLLCIPLLVLLAALDAYALLAAGLVLSVKWAICYLLAALAAFLGAYVGISTMRFLAVHTDLSGFAYYCWGAALFLFLLYLIV